MTAFLSMPHKGRPVSPFIVERDGRLQWRERREKKEKKKEKNEGMGLSTASLLFVSSQDPLVVRGMEAGVIPESCLLLEKRAFRVNPDEAPHAMSGVGGVK
jgi:hypothetical protein